MSSSNTNSPVLTSRAKRKNLCLDLSETKKNFKRRCKRSYTPPVSTTSTSSFPNYNFYVNLFPFSTQLNKSSLYYYSSSSLILPNSFSEENKNNNNKRLLVPAIQNLVNEFLPMKECIYLQKHMCHAWSDSYKSDKSTFNIPYLSINENLLKELNETSSTTLLKGFNHIEKLEIYIPDFCKNESLSFQEISEKAKYYSQKFNYLLTCLKQNEKHGMPSKVSIKYSNTYVPCYNEVCIQWTEKFLYPLYNYLTSLYKEKKETTKTLLKSLSIDKIFYYEKAISLPVGLKILLEIPTIETFEVKDWDNTNFEFSAILLKRFYAEKVQKGLSCLKTLYLPINSCPESSSSGIQTIMSLFNQVEKLYFHLPKSFLLSSSSKKIDSEKEQEEEEVVQKVISFGSILSTYLKSLKQIKELEMEFHPSFIFVSRELEELRNTSFPNLTSLKIKGKLNPFVNEIDIMRLLVCFNNMEQVEIPSLKLSSNYRLIISGIINQNRSLKLLKLGELSYSFL